MLAMAIEKTPKPPGADLLRAATERPGLPDAELRRLLEEEDPLVIAARLRERGIGPSPRGEDVSPPGPRNRQRRPGSSRRERGADKGERKVTIRVDPERYGLLEDLAAHEGVAPTTMARLLFSRVLREAGRDLEFGP
jgi:hypothetical protein